MLDVIAKRTVDFLLNQCEVAGLNGRFAGNVKVQFDPVQTKAGE